MCVCFSFNLVLFSFFFLVYKILAEGVYACERVSVCGKGCEFVLFNRFEQSHGTFFFSGQSTKTNTTNRPKVVDLFFVIFCSNGHFGHSNLVCMFVSNKFENAV